MTFKTTIVALILGLAPTLSLACPWHEQQAQSCAQGYAWDAESEQCIKQVTS